MIELIMVIVIVGILSAVAIPKLAMNRNDAIITTAKTTVSSIRSALATEKQKRVLSGNFTPITTLSVNTGINVEIFDGFDGVAEDPVLEYPLQSCEDATADGCWIFNGINYTYRMPSSGITENFILSKNRFVCVTPANDACKQLTNR